MFRISSKINTNLFLKIVAGFIVVLTVLFIGAFVFFQTKGKQIVIDKLSAAFGRRVDIDSIQVRYPLGLSIKNFNVDGYGFVKEVSIGLGVLHLLGNDLKFSSVVFYEPQIVLHRLKDKTVIIGDLPPVTSDAQTSESPAEPEAPGQPAESAQPVVPAPPAPQSAKNKKAPPFSMDKLVIKNGAVSFFDHSSAEEFQVLVSDIDLDVRHLSFNMKPARTKFNLNAKIVMPKTQTPTGEIISRGWLNLAKKDMKGELKIENLDGRIFSSFYGNAVKTDFKNIIADLFVEAESKDNDMTVKGRLQVKDFAFDSKQKDSHSLEDIILGGLQSMAKGLTLEFSFKTKMDNFKMESISFSGNIFSRAFEGLPKEPQLVSRF